MHKMVLATRLGNHFKEYLIEFYIPRYFMEAKLILISKYGTEYPKIEQTRPISVLPTITKIFELSILHHLERAVDSIRF